MITDNIQLSTRSLNSLLPKIAKFRNLGRYDGVFYFIDEPGEQIQYPILDREGAKAFLQTVAKDENAISF